MVQAVIFLLAGMLAMPVVANGFALAGGITQLTPTRFSICYNDSCASVATDSISEEDWRRATAPFPRGANTAAEERAVIADSIAILEETVGVHLGTSVDKGDNLAGFGRPKQLDCIDESTNTNTYLRMLERDGLFRFHTVADRSTRFGIFIGMPHTTSVIREKCYRDSLCRRFLVL